MAFKRALWKSGLTYEHQCEYCQTIVRYTDDKLDFRPWYPDGFVYCPKCQKPLRHSEKLAIDSRPVEVVDLTNSSSTPSEPFCASCGEKFMDGDKFCSHCGRKRQ